VRFCTNKKKKSKKRVALGFFNKNGANGLFFSMWAKHGLKGKWFIFNGYLFFYVQVAAKSSPGLRWA